MQTVLTSATQGVTNDIEKPFVIIGEKINQALFSLALGKGATGAITDPLKLTSTIQATDLLMGRDNYGTRSIKHGRDHQPQEG